MEQSKKNFSMLWSFLLMTPSLVFFIFISCNTASDSLLMHVENTREVTPLDSLKLNFAKSLFLVLSESDAARQYLRAEALKMFDNDHDVLYMLSKDEEIQNGESLEQLMLKHMDSEDLLALIKEIPTLTILVPTLPLNSFCPNTWDALNEIPCVAFENKRGEIQYIDLNGEVDIFKDAEIPMFPIVFIKESERVIVNSLSTRGMSSNILETKSGMNFVFTDDVFDNVHTEKNKNVKVRSTSNEIPTNMSKVFEAKQVADLKNVWQRDYVYYDIDDLLGRGSFKSNYSEHLCSFQLIGTTAQNLFNIISDQPGDPTHVNTVGRGSSSTNKLWTDGSFEFNVKVYVSSKTGIGNEIIKKFFASGDNLFELDIEYRPRSSTGIVKGVRSTHRYVLPEPLLLFDWDLENYTTQIKISIDEVDSKQTHTNTIETSAVFATNFEFDASIGEKKKIGAKLGGSSTITEKSSFTITTTLESDPLGETIVTFGDDIIIGNEMIDLNPPVNSGGGRREPTHNPNYAPPFNPKYTSGMFKIELSPLRVY